MEKLLRVAEMRDLEGQVSNGKISYSRMVEIINEKHFIKLVEVKQELKDKKEWECQFIKCIKCGKNIIFITNETLGNRI